MYKPTTRGHPLWKVLYGIRVMRTWVCDELNSPRPGDKIRLCWAIRQRRVAGVRLEVIYGQEAEGFYAWQELLRDRRDERDTQ